MIIKLNDISNQDPHLTNMSYQALNCVPSTLMRTPTEGFAKLFKRLLKPQQLEISASIEDNKIKFSLLSAIIPSFYGISLLGHHYIELRNGDNIYIDEFITGKTNYIYLSMSYNPNDTLTGDYPLDDLVFNIYDTIQDKDLYIGKVDVDTNGNLSNLVVTDNRHLYGTDITPHYIYGVGAFVGEVMDGDGNISLSVEEKTINDLENEDPFGSSYGWAYATLNVNSYLYARGEFTDDMRNGEFIIPNSGIYTVDFKLGATWYSIGGDLTYFNVWVDFYNNGNLISTKYLNINEIDIIYDNGGAGRDFPIFGKITYPFNKGDKLKIRFRSDAPDWVRDKLRLKNIYYDINIKKDI